LSWFGRPRAAVALRSAGFPVLYVYDGGGDLRSIGVWLRPRLGRQDGGPLAARCGGLDRRGAPCMYMYHQFDQWFAALGIFMSSGGRMGECGNASRVESCTSGGDHHLQEVYGVFNSSLGCATPSASNLNSERTVYTHSYPELCQTVIFTFARFPPSCHAQWTACGSFRHSSLAG